ncbi:MAG: dethiobiotin synthase [Flavipsychrobacter sp.]|nr:dethiobiotin synthase [Flavipsychrobacter sp.]
MKTIAIAGIHTGIGKTIASAVIAEALGADYWKPVQAGDLEHSDTITVSGLLANGASRVHPEAIRLSQPLSPHAAALIDNVQVNYKDFTFPHTANALIVETAGGVHSPINDTDTMADFISHYQLPTLLVSRNYLGSINHTLMSIEVLKARGILLPGIIISGDRNEESERFIERYGGVPIIAHIPQFSELAHEHITQQALIIQNALRQKLGHE